MAGDSEYTNEDLGSDINRVAAKVGGSIASIFLGKETGNAIAETGGAISDIVDRSSGRKEREALRGKSVDELLKKDSANKDAGQKKPEDTKKEPPKLADTSAEKIRVPSDPRASSGARPKSQAERLAALREQVQASLKK